MSNRRRLRFLIAVPSLIIAAAVGTWACGDDSTDPAANPDSGVPLADSGPNNTLDSTTQQPSDANNSVDSNLPTIDPTQPVTCKTLHANNPGAPSGIFAIDLDGNGGAFQPMNVYCDMAFEGGGWTMIQSFTGVDSPGSLGTTDGGPGLLVGMPEPGKLGAFTGPYVEALAKVSAQVHIRRSFEADGGANTWVTSKEPDAGGATLVITNLRNLDVLTKDTDGGFEEWTGPQANATKLAWVPLYGGGPGTCFTPVHQTKYPSIYWACGNFDSMNLYAPQSLCRWTYTPNTGNEPMEVLVR